MANILNFSALGIVAESDKHQLRDDGFVPDIKAHDNFICIIKIRT